MNAFDVHSFSQPDRVRVTHCSLSLRASFDERVLSGTAQLRLQRSDPDAPLVLDTRDLQIHAVTAGAQELSFEVGPRDPVLGSALTIELPAGDDSVCIRYTTHPGASGLQWLTPRQTAGKQHPFLFSQNQSIHARSWIPLQDSPGVRITYDARIEPSENLRVLMSANRTAGRAFEMNLAVPPYLIALAIGDLDFVELGPRTGIYAEPPVLAAAAREFEDTERLVTTIERLYGPYRWGRYDLLVLPPSFPFGGMENPCLTFVTPTVIAGDKSLVSLISHELAHSWSGNLVTNATWRDFWLNEGFTTYLENRIQEEVYGREQALMEQVLDRRELEKELSELPPADQILHVDLTGRDPDEGCTYIPYFKGALFLRQMEQVFGRGVFDVFIRSYFDRFAFQSITTAEALEYLRQELFARFPEKALQIPLDNWVNDAGLPASAPRSRSPRLEEVASAPAPLTTWSTQEWLEYLKTLPRPLTDAKLSALDANWNLTRSGNHEILEEWLLIAIENTYQAAYPRLESYLQEVGRTSLVKPLYAALAKTPEGEILARKVYAEARAGYHPITQTAVDKVLAEARHFSK
ncbi:MAG TPA: M1 family metallopeptidase [Bryobacteraceae bacterium]|nr:M1 family metallopeptidase [Bryobacteraceae bacterium]